MPTPITVSVNFIDLFGTAIPGYMVATIVPPTGVRDLYVAGTGIISPKSVTSTTGTSVSVQLWGNDVVVDAADGAMDTYYTVNLFNNLNQLVWTAAYLFTGAGPINLVGFPILNPVPAPVAPTFPVVQPPGGSNGDIQYNNSGVFGGSDNFIITPPQITFRNSGTLTPTGLAVINGVGLGTSYTGSPTLLEVLCNNNTSWLATFANDAATGNTGTTRQDYLGIFQANTGGGGLVWNTAGAVFFTLNADPTDHVSLRATGLFDVSIGANGTSVTPTYAKFVHNSNINFFLAQNSATPDIFFAAGGNTTWQNITAATNVLNQSSPTLTLKGSYWNGAASVSNTWTLQDVTSAGSNPVRTLTLTGGTSAGGELFRIMTALTVEANAAFNAALTMPNGILSLGLVSGATALLFQGNTPATNIVNINSGVLKIVGEYWDGAVSQHDNWTFQNILGTGTNPTTTLTLGHTGSSGVATVAAPTLGVTAATPTGPAGRVSFGTTVGFGTGAAGTAVTTTLKGGGTGPTTPQTVVNYIQIDIAGTKYYIPLVQ